MDLARLGMQKEIAIDREEVRGKGDIFVFREDIRRQHRLHRTRNVLWLRASSPAL